LISPVYCTYFDQHYLARGITMLRSLHRVLPGVQCHVMAMDPLTATILERTFPGQLTVTCQTDLLAADPELAALRSCRPGWPFYATHKPIFLLHTLSHLPPDHPAVFIDADTWFFSSPEPLHAEINQAQAALSPHRFPPENRHLEKYGRFNAGFLSFRNSPQGLQILSDWRRDCLDWCDETPQPDGRFMNQGYLNHWPARYPGVHIIQHPGANLAPWNINGHHLDAGAEAPNVDGHPLIFYHFSQTQRDSQGRWFSLANYFPNQTGFVIPSIYQPYLQAVEAESLVLQRLHNIDACSTLRHVQFSPAAIRVY
jgi:hypothetical protein